jgi:lysozyme family protein
MKKLEDNINNPMGKNTFSPIEMLIGEEELKMKNNPSETSTKSNSSLYTVKSGESLSILAKKHGVTPDALKKANPDKLQSWNGVEGFNAGEKITIPVEKVKEEKKPLEIIKELYKDYTDRKIDTIKLASELMNFTTDNGEAIISTIDKLPNHIKDNVYFAMANQSTNLELTQFDNSLLETMAKHLGDWFNTASWGKNWKQENRINKLLSADNKKRYEKLNKSGFEKYQKHIFDHEGGFVNDPVDKGGATNKGITFRTFKAYAKKDLGIEPTLENLKKLTNEQAAKIYKKRYWDKIKADEINNSSLAYQIYDFYVNAGGNAVKVLQRTLNKMGNNLTIDGVLGENTIKTLNTENSKKLFEKYKKARIEYYNDIVENDIKNYKLNHKNTNEKELLKYTNKKFLKGWLKRTKSINYEEEKN